MEGVGGLGRAQVLSDLRDLIGRGIERGHEKAKAAVSCSLCLRLSKKHEIVFRD